jgi:thiamine transport system substrate-binding protein
VRADAALGDGGSDLFREANPDAIGNYDALEEGLAFDSQNRVVPTETSYISLVYSQNDIDAPKTLDDLLRPAYEGALLTQDPTRSETGLGFLLRTIENKPRTATSSTGRRCRTTASRSSGRGRTPTRRTRTARHRS